MQQGPHMPGLGKVMAPQLGSIENYPVDSIYIRRILQSVIPLLSKSRISIDDVFPLHQHQYLILTRCRTAYLRRSYNN